MKPLQRRNEAAANMADRGSRSSASKHCFVCIAFWNWGIDRSIFNHDVAIHVITFKLLQKLRQLRRIRLIEKDENT